MLTKDTEKIQAHREQEAIENTRETLETNEKQDLWRESLPLTPDGGMDVTSSEQRMGRPMYVKTVMKLLKKVNPNFHFEVSMSDPTKMGIYLLCSYKLPGMEAFSDKLFLCGMENGVMPEYSLMEAEVKAIPDPEAPEGMRYIPAFKKETRGWKTVLAALLKKRVITPSECDRWFKTELGQGSQRWKEFRHTPIEMIGEDIHLGDTDAAETRDQGNPVPEG